MKRKIVLFDGNPFQSFTFKIFLFSNFGLISKLFIFLGLQGSIKIQYNNTPHMKWHGWLAQNRNKKKLEEPTTAGITPRWIHTPKFGSGSQPETFFITLGFKQIKISLLLLERCSHSLRVSTKLHFFFQKHFSHCIYCQCQWTVHIFCISWADSASVLWVERFNSSYLSKMFNPKVSHHSRAPQCPHPPCLDKQVLQHKWKMALKLCQSHYVDFLLRPPLKAESWW